MKQNLNSKKGSQKNLSKCRHISSHSFEENQLHGTHYDNYIEGMYKVDLDINSAFKEQK